MHQTDMEAVRNEEQRASGTVNRPQIVQSMAQHLLIVSCVIVFYL